MNSHAIALIAGSRDRWKVAGDQPYVDPDPSEENLPPESSLKNGGAVIEITSIPNNGCRKFADRLGVEAVKFVNSPEGNALLLRGLKAKVVVPGVAKKGDRVEKLSTDQ